MPAAKMCCVHNTLYGRDQPHAHPREEEEGARKELVDRLAVAEAAKSAADAARGAAEEKAQELENRLKESEIEVGRKEEVAREELVWSGGRMAGARPDHSLPTPAQSQASQRFQNSYF